MSGICGVVRLDAAPVAPETVRAMTSFMAFRGPDAQHSWTGTAAGLGHAMLRTTHESQHERQPASLDGAVWISADARIDARDELKAELASSGRRGLAACSDAQLILHAYHAWGEGCVERLLGDFAFAIWDAPQRRLFCARDPLGVKAFFHASVGPWFIFSNTLNCVRTHPAVSDALDDLAIADFLLFEANQDPAGTAFADIRRLAPGTCLTVSPQGARTRKYWTLPFDARVRYRAAGDYVERFRHLLDTAVADRLRTDRLGVELSGGLDSTTVAASAVALLRRQARPFEVNALTVIYESLIPDDERRFAAMAAARLGIPVRYFNADPYALYGGGERHGGPPEPRHDPLAAAEADAFRAGAACARVMLTGLDGDTLFNESPKPYFRALARERRLLALASGLVWYAISERRIVPLGWRRRSDAGRPAPSPYPEWVSPDLEARYDLRARWRQVHGDSPAEHPVRPHALRTLQSIVRASSFFEYLDPGVTGVPLEHRHPLLDLRVVEFALAIPPLPWCVRKTLLREAMRGVLPEPILRRPKTPLAGSAVVELMRRPEARWVDDFVPAPQLARYVERTRIPGVHAEPDAARLWSNLRPLSLSIWLTSLQQEKSKQTTKEYA